MEIVNIRIDERLIHGQVAAIWSKALGVSRMMVIDEDAVKNPTQKSVLKMACPVDCKLSILSVASAATNLRERKYEGDRVFIVVRSPATLRSLYDAGYPFTAVNVGNMAKKDNSAAVSRSVYVTPADVEDFKYLAGKGVAFGIQRVPTEASETLMDKL
jgi:PTS system mannose-specific IIB component